MLDKLKLEEPLLYNINTSNYAVFAEQNVRILNTELFGTIFFGFASYINSRLIRSYCEIGRYCSIGRNVSVGLGNHNTKGLSTSPFFEHLIPKDSLKLASNNPKRRVIIGNDVWIGDNAMIASGIKIGDGSVIAGGAVVTKDVEPYSIVGGVPAKLIKMRFNENIVARLMKLSWWNLNPTLLKSLPFEDIESTIGILEKVSHKDNNFLQNYARITPQDSKNNKFKGSQDYWENRYKQGGTSGAGSYNTLGDWKAATINTILKKINISTVIEWGCGDGNLLKNIDYPAYLGFDVSPKAISICMDKYHKDKTKTFQLVSNYKDEKANLCISLDVIYHLVEDTIYQEYMNKLFESSDKYVVIYSSNHEEYNENIQHVKHRMFSNWVEMNKTQWNLIEHIKNDFPYTGNNNSGSISSFYIYEKIFNRKDLIKEIL